MTEEQKKYKEYLRRMVAQEQKALEKADDISVREAISRRLKAFLEDLKECEQ